MLPAWLLSLAAEFGVAVTKWAVTESYNALRDAQERAEQERLNGIRNGANAKAYHEAQTRHDQIKAAINLLNRNDS